MLSDVLGAVDKTSSSFSAHGKIGNFIIIIITSQPDQFDVAYIATSAADREAAAETSYAPEVVQINPFTASCSRLLLFEGFSAILV